MSLNATTTWRRRVVVAAAVLACTAAAPAAQGTPPAHAEVCAACHGAQGRSVSADIPHLAGQRRAYLQKQLKAFRMGERKHDLMEPIARQLSDDDIALLAAFWSRLPPAGEPDAPLSVGLPSAMQMPTDFPKGFTVYETVADEGTQIVRLYGPDTAVVTARLWLKGTGPDGAFDRRLWFSDTYVRTPQGWRYAFGQSSISLP